MSKLPKPSLSITYHQSFNKSNLLVKNIGFRRNLTFCCISVQIFNSLNRLKLIFVGFTRKSEKSGQYYWSSSRISSKSVKITQTPWYFSNGQKVSKLRGPVKITRTQDYANPTVLCYAFEVMQISTILYIFDAKGVIKFGQNKVTLLTQPVNWRLLDRTHRVY